MFVLSTLPPVERYNIHIMIFIIKHTSKYYQECMFIHSWYYPCKVHAIERLAGVSWFNCVVGYVYVDHSTFLNTSASCEIIDSLCHSGKASINWTIPFISTVNDGTIVKKYSLSE